MTTQESQVARVCAVDDLRPGMMRRADLDPPVAVYNVDGAFFATADGCSHAQSSLSESGCLEGDHIECGWHGARFSVRTGEVLAPPATVPLKRYEVRVIDGDVYVVTDAPPASPESQS